MLWPRSLHVFAAVLATIDVTAQPWNANDVCTTFPSPTVAIYISPKLIWAEPPAEGAENALQFCKANCFNDAIVGETVIDYPCEDNDEESFADWSGGGWENKPTGSANRCYKMFESIECCRNPQDVRDCREECQRATCTCPERDPDYEGDYNGNCVDVAGPECHAVYVQCLNTCYAPC